MASADYKITEGQRVRVTNRQDLGIGEVLRVRKLFGIYQADVLFEDQSGRRLDSFPIERLELAPDLWQRLGQAQSDLPIDFFLKQMAFLFPLQNSGGQLSNSRTHLLPHQILLTRDVVLSSRRRLLIADEVGLGKTIEMGMILRELIARDQARRILIVTPAGLIKNWQDELRDAFRLYFKILGTDFIEHSVSSWEQEDKVIASIDTIKKPARMERLLNAPTWDLIVFDEAHHISRLRYGNKINTTQNYRLAEALRYHTRDLFFLSATPHQGDIFQFWSLVQLLDDSIFENEQALQAHRGLLNSVMVRRTKREVTDAQGQPIFMRRQVHTQSFQLSTREQYFYEQLTLYLKEGYSAAGLGQAKTTAEQRAIGFVMTTFQKIMSSSLRAIRQALRRRLLVLLIKQHFTLEGQRRKSPQAEGIAENIMRVQDEMRQVASEILGVHNPLARQVDLDAYIAQMRQRISKKYQLEDDATEWAIEGEDDDENIIYGASDIPNEIAKVRSLLKIIPGTRDRKFDTLLRAIDGIRTGHPEERFIIFTQYRETLEFLREELEQIYGKAKVVTIKGGPLADKLEAVEKIWAENGAQFLISTSAGGEGINLHVAHILFNYDLPWNPMAVEQRIGRVHRFGQYDTVQVYNLMAEDTVEAQIYHILENKLREIAAQIGKIDLSTGEPTEDFRSDILGFIGSSPNYQDLYKRALIDRDYARTEREISAAMENARQASDALKELTQDLNAFSLSDYQALENKISLQDLQQFSQKALVRMGGGILPNGEGYKIDVPNALLHHPNILPRYESGTFDREIAMRKRRIEFFGLGHPLIDALISHWQQPEIHGEIVLLPRMANESENYLVALVSIILELEDKNRHDEVKIIRLSQSGDIQLMSEDWLLKRAADFSAQLDHTPTNFDAVIIDKFKATYEGALAALVSQAKMSVKPAILNARINLMGLMYFSN